MVQPISASQLQQYREQVKAGGVDAAVKVYNELYNKGYGYAGWAKGVADGLGGLSPTGYSAIYFLQRSFHDDHCRLLSFSEIDKIRIDMAINTLNKYIEIANDNNGVLDREIEYKEARQVHEKTFKDNGAEIDNWTLDLPMELIKKEHGGGEAGDAAVEAYWQNLAKTGGDGPDAWGASAAIYWRVLAAAYTAKDAAIRGRAHAWLKNNPDPKWAIPGNFRNDASAFAGESLACQFKRAKKWIWPRDPIILDLDGDGLQTVGLSGNVYFDHDGDGVLSKTGWVGQGDALLVWDRNANGRIDSGAELFGDFTPLPNGSLAPNGFAALAALDSNGDGVLNASDPAFAELKLWKDNTLNGQTEAGELITLAEAGISALNLAPSLKNQNIGNGNTLVRQGSFIRSDGSTGDMGEFHLAINTTASRFAEEIAVPDAIKNLPYIAGSGKVRELWQAAAQSPEIGQILQRFKNATTPKEQQALVEELLVAWANTLGMKNSLEARAAGQYRIQYDAFGSTQRSQHLNKEALNSSTGNLSQANTFISDANGEYLTESYRELIADWSRKLHVLEAFNGQYFFNLPQENSQTATANWGLSVEAGSTENKAKSRENKQPCQWQSRNKQAKKKKYQNII